MRNDDLYAVFCDPPPEFTQIPWWFWNDELTEEEIVRQIRGFRDHGVLGFTIHPRLGLPRSIEYMGERYLNLVRVAVEEAARNGMVVHLYDEGMYPSGSAHGMVVRENPEWASRGLEMREVEADAPVADLNSDERLVARVAMSESGDTRVLASEESPPREEEWRTLAFLDVPSGGHIRGVHEGEDDGEAGAPRSADLLNPEAMAAFVRLTHDRYYAALPEHFGRTIRAIFTDEPSLLGRSGRRGLQPWTRDFHRHFARTMGYDLVPFLPALWMEIGTRTDQIREDFARAVGMRLEASYYAQLSRWADEHGIALTGHPAEPDDLGLLRHFQIPGQDVVWRWMMPWDANGLEGPQSTQGKCSSSAARHFGRRRNGNECFGAFGWSLTMEEMKAIADWLFVRGVNLLWPHAFFYSIRGFRVSERPPDMGPHNLWWPHYRLFADYTRRMCWLNTDAAQVCSVAILGSPHHLPWRAAKALFQHQVAFDYLEDRLLTERCGIENGEIAIEAERYRAVVLDHTTHLAPEIRGRLERFAAGGGTVVIFGEGPPIAGGVSVTSEPALLSALDRTVGRDVELHPAHPNLRAAHLVKEGVHLYLLTNEGDEPLSGELRVSQTGRAELWDGWQGTRRPARVLRAAEDDMVLPLELERWESIVLSVLPGEPPETEQTVPRREMLRTVDLRAGWSIEEQVAVPENPLSSWAAWPGMTSFSGTMTYICEFQGIDAPAGTSVWLDLGEVHDFAAVTLNGRDLGVRMWAPFRWEVTGDLRPGTNALRVRVTNSLANRYEDAARPSGLMGPVRIDAETRLRVLHLTEAKPCPLWY